MRALLLLLLLAAAVAAVPARWERVESAVRDADDELLPLTFLIQQPRIAELRDLVDEISNPKSPMFRRWLTDKQVGEYVRAPESTIAITELLYRLGASDVTVHYRGEFVSASLPRDRAESLLHVHLDLYRDSVTGREVWRDPTFTVPEPLRAHVAHVLGVSNFPTELVRLDTTCSPANTVCIDSLISFYGISDAVRTAGAEAVSIFNDAASGQYYSSSDLLSYLSIFAPGASIAVRVDGDNSGGASCGAACSEAALDAQTVGGIAFRGTIEMFMSQGIVGSDSLFDFFAVVQNIKATMNLDSLVASISYGGEEASNDAGYIQAMENEAIKAAALGITIVAASGDWGVQGYSSHCGVFRPLMPASLPHVLSVGATRGVEAGVAETTCSYVAGESGGPLITSGGGFSTLFPRPSYQNAAVAAYNAATANSSFAPLSSQYAASGRAYPDIAAAGHAFPLVLAGSTVYADGTSASAPLVAAQLALMNKQLKMSNQAPVGFINPFLYSLPASNFNDVTVGDNRCGDYTQSCCASGFAAVAGWDPVTGLGSMKFDSVLASALGTYAAITYSSTPRSDANSVRWIGDIIY